MVELNMRTIAIVILFVVIAAMSIIFIFNVYSEAETGGTGYVDTSDELLEESKSQASGLFLEVIDNPEKQS